MSYNIIKTDGTPLATVADGQTNSTASSLTLIGKNYAGYGTFLNENFIRILENFSSSSAPLNPLVGQLWWRSDTRLLQVYDKFGNWKTISGAQSTSDAPTNAISGDLWFDTVNQQLKVYSGASWVVIGPSFTATTGTSGAIADTIIDTGLVSHVVVKFFVQNNLLAILSKDTTFTPGTSIPGFATVKPGINLASDRVPALIYYDNANNASYLGGVLASNYLTKTTPLIESQLEIQNPDGLKITEIGGTLDYFDVQVSSNYVNLTGLYRGNGLKIRTKPDNAGGLVQDVLTVDRNSGLITVLGDPAAGQPLGVATKGYVDTSDTAIKGFISSNVNTLTSTLNTLTANTTNVYGNVRILQSDLGIVGGPVAGFANTTPWRQLVIDSGQTLAANLISLWANLASIHSNVLSRTGDAPAATASMFSNVRLLQSTVSSLGTGSVLKDGSQPVTGVIVPDLTNTRDFGSVAARWKDVHANASVVQTVVKSGTGGVGDIGGSGSRFGTVWCSGLNSDSTTATVTGTWTLPTGSTFQASYADLAERYAADAVYPAGTIVSLGGTHEVTQENTALSEEVFGVVSHDFAYLMNQSAGDNDTHPPVALTGRVKVRVIGRVRQGQRIVAAGNGCARGAGAGEATPFNVIGRAITAKTSDEEALHECVVSIN